MAEKDNDGMGAYRFILAVLVALYHVGFKAYGYNTGVVAVVSFFILSGYVMEALGSKYYLGLSRARLFYLDRLIRIYPQFFTYLVMTIVLVLVKKPHEQFFLNNVTATNVVLNFALFPLGFYDYIPGLSGCLFIPPAWTIGLELCFYVLVPFLVTFKIQKKLYYLSLCVFISACIGQIPTEMYGYRLLPGTLFIFLCGCFIYNHRKENVPPVLVIVTWVISLVLFFIVNSTTLYKVDYNKEVILGILVGLPAIWVLRRQGSNNSIFNAIDELLGNLSYGVFLNHFFVKWTLDTYFNGVNFTMPSLSLFFCISITLSFATFRLAEAPLIALRRGLRDNYIQSAKPQSHSPYNA